MARNYAGLACAAAWVIFAWVWALLPPPSLASSPPRSLASFDGFISHSLTNSQNHIHQWMSAERPAVCWQKNRSPGITPSIIPGPLFSILSHAAASRQREGGALFDVPAQMLNDSDTKRGPTAQVLTGQFSIGERLDLTFFFF